MISASRKGINMSNTEFRKLLDLQLFADSDPAYPGAGNNPFYLNINRTTDPGFVDPTTGLPVYMQTYYSDYMIDNAEPYLVHKQFAQHVRKAQGSGPDIQFRKYDPYEKALTPLLEGITPNGKKLTMSIVKGTAKQYGDYTSLTDVVNIFQPDNQLVAATRLHGSQAGRTLDTIAREVMNGGTNVQYYDGTVFGRHLLVGGSQTPANNNYLTVDCIRRAARFLKTQNANKINGDWVAIIHPDVSYDLMSDPNWKYPHQYVDTDNIYEGEIGKIEGVRFVETTEAKVWHAEDLSPTSRTLTVSSVSSNVVTISGTVTASSLVGRWVIIGDKRGYVGANTANTLTLYTDSTKTQALTVSASSGTVVYPGEAGAAGRDVYSTLVLGADAYGDVELEGGSLQTIVKQLGSAGTGDPLNQRATTGWKCWALTVRLVEAFMIRIETTSTFESGAN